MKRKSSFSIQTFLLTVLSVMICMLIPTVACAETADDELCGSGSFTNSLYDGIIEDQERSDVRTSSELLQSAQAQTVFAHRTLWDAAGELRTEMAKREKTIPIYYNGSDPLTDAEIQMIWFYAFAETGVATHGDYLRWSWLTAEYGYAVSQSGSRYNTYIEFYVTYTTTAEQENELSRWIGGLDSQVGIKSRMMPYEKAMLLYKYICENITLDTTANGKDVMPYTAYGALKNKTATPQGYVMLLYRVLTRHQIPCRIVVGECHGIPHLWNIMAIDNKWYNMDCVLDSDAGAMNHFLKTPDKFPYHVREAEYDDETFHAQQPMAQTDYLPPSGLLDSPGGGWAYYKDGIIDTTYVGLAKYKDTYYYVEDGYINQNYTGLTLYNGTWYYVIRGTLLWGYYGLVQYEGMWFYVENSAITWTYTGLAEYNGAWFYVENSAINWGYTGLCLNDGNYYYVENGCLNWGFTGLYLHNYTWYVIQGGQLIWGYDGLVLYNDLWFYAENSVITFTFTGLAEYEGILFYFEGSCLNWSYNGKAEYNGVEYDVVNGMAFF